VLVAQWEVTSRNGTRQAGEAGRIGQTKLAWANGGGSSGRGGSTGEGVILGVHSPLNENVGTAVCRCEPLSQCQRRKERKEKKRTEKLKKINPAANKARILVEYIPTYICTLERLIVIKPPPKIACSLTKEGRMTRLGGESCSLFLLHRYLLHVTPYFSVHVSPGQLMSGCSFVDSRVFPLMGDVCTYLERPSSRIACSR
jgi:hypothetical protein